ncbi:MAG TPA: hypothetical protein VFE54_04715 [Mucilaginibacter sp.]|jgi:hypothetical protein|nr:hypothetical protein [Mucilaginibacter sp.]
MDNSFLAYLQRLELIGFFSGYPLIYTIALFIAGNQRLKNTFISRIAPLLPFSYALVGTLFLGFELKKLYPDYSVEHIKQAIEHPYLVIWGLLAILFWISALSKKIFFSLLHSLVFFFLIVSDIFMQLNSSADSDIVRNDMKVYTSSLFLNLCTLAFLVLISFLFRLSKKRLDV